MTKEQVLTRLHDYIKSGNNFSALDGSQTWFHDIENLFEYNNDEIRCYIVVNEDHVLIIIPKISLIHGFYIKVKRVYFDQVNSVSEDIISLIAYYIKES